MLIVKKMGKEFQLFSAKGKLLLQSSKTEEIAHLVYQQDVVGDSTSINQVLKFIAITDKEVNAITWEFIGLQGSLALYGLIEFQRPRDILSLGLFFSNFCCEDCNSSFFMLQYFHTIYNYISMKLAPLIEIGRKVIYIAGFYKHYTPEEKPKLEQKLFSFQSELEKNSDKYSKKLLRFIEDLLGDLSKNIPLEIDELFEDDFVGNYYYTKKQVEMYNNLLDEALYKEILAERNEEELDKLVEKMYVNFKEQYEKLDKEKISSSLLIFTSFDYHSPKGYLTRMYQLKHKFSFISLRKIEQMLGVYDYFLQEIYNFGIQNLKNNTIHYKYIQAAKNTDNKDISIDFHLVDTSKFEYRTGNVKEEYKELLKKLR